ncbi:O-ACyltransferase [Caldicellulosiruptor hydrothermalis 108]|uniref:O-ACyltransferase n=1 Tax=Caldicellulosiruptor hydrothermalis (strain DSM 18901 / VKM B-2411 / 108) TaxID=632292 RepID=E4QDQ5_CALH1|nr:hypothetical protein [Caldicellulosiruptor hydrothermalis]ADQ06472.1 O-ACyltransferase [Caldicellulosiruptor hydrothermalis 108]
MIKNKLSDVWDDVSYFLYNVWWYIKEFWLIFLCMLLDVVLIIFSIEVMIESLRSK